MVDTNWSIITGPPSSGKTTLINALSAKGYKVEHEVARAYISQMLKYHSIEQIRAKGLELQRKILSIKELREQHLSPKDRIFFDRGIPDSIAYYQYYGLDFQEAVESSKTYRYQHVFYLEGLPVEQDDIRKEDAHMAHELGDLIYHAYRCLGYRVITLPAVPVCKRLELVEMSI